MFTGIVQSQAEVYSVQKKDNASQIVLCVAPELLKLLTLGASIAVNGVCLTVVKFEQINVMGYLTFDVIDETLRVSNLANIKRGDHVNVERSLKMGDELGGHVVSGHVHCQATLIDKKQTDHNCALTFSCDRQWMKYIFSKGFITINGVSLTLGVVEKNTFTIHLIPETLARTNLGCYDIEQCVNVEVEQQTMTIVNTIDLYMHDQQVNKN